MKRKNVISRSNPFALPCLASSSKRFETDCALNRLHARLSVTMLPKKRHVSLTPTGKSAFLTHFQRQARPCSLAARIQGATACASPEESNEKRHFYLPISRCLHAKIPLIGSRGFCMLFLFCFFERVQPQFDLIDLIVLHFHHFDRERLCIDMFAWLQIDVVHLNPATDCIDIFIVRKP